MKRRQGQSIWFFVIFALAPVLLSSCQYARMARPSVLKQLNPDVARLVNEFPNVDRQNKAIIAKMFALGGLVHAQSDGNNGFKAKVTVEPNQFIWKPAIITMDRPGDIDVEFSNPDQTLHMAYLPSNGDRQLLELQPGTAGHARLTLDQPGMYFFGCPVANHAGRGMMGFILVKGDTPAEARLDRPKQPRP